MKKKSIGRLAAVSLAAMTAVSSVVITASAVETIRGEVYKVTVTTQTSVGGLTTTGKPVTTYYTSKADADAAATAAANAGSSVDRASGTVQSIFGYGVTVYVSADNKIITTTKTDGYTQYLTPTSGGSSTGTPTGSGSSYVKYPYQSTSDLVYYSAVTHRWYPNMASLYADGGQSSYTSKASNYSSVNCWFDTATGVYESFDDADHVLIYGERSNYDYYYDHYYGSDWSTYDVYKVNGRYYPTLSEAESAAARGGYSIEKVRDYGAPQTNYFSYTTGLYYNSYSAALAASGNNSSNVRTFSYYSGDYYDGYYNGYYGYGDPASYYWYIMYGNGLKKDDTDSNDTTTASVGNRKGWTAVAKYLGKLKSGSSVKVSMNYETTIPSSVMSAIKGKNVTVKFVLKNGATFSINGKDISSAKSIDIDTTYNTDNIPSKLVKAAYKKNDAVSTAQISIESGSFGAAADITVKFSAKRAGYTAKLYRYNPSKKTLSLVDSAKVQDNGKCTFGEVTKGGDFVIVIC